MNEKDTSLYGKNREGKVALCETCAYDGYWRAKVETQLEGKPFVENERYERRKHKITRISRPQ